MIAVLDYGIGNLRSAHKALLHVGADARLVTSAAAAAGAHGVVLPGVGAFGACAGALRASGLDEVVLDAVASGRPLLGLCVGFQLLFEGSEESPDARGLGIVPGVLSRLPAGVKRPQMQWNLTAAGPRPSRLLPAGAAPAWFYYVHSFAAPLDETTAPSCSATCEYGCELVAVLEHDAVLGTQFHPEKSGTAGLELLARFVALCGEPGAR